MINIENFKWEDLPFFDYVVTIDNYDKIESCENFNLKIKKFFNYIELSFKNTYSSNFFYYIDKNDKKYLSLSEDNLAKYLLENNIVLELHINKEYENWKIRKIEDKANWSITQLNTNKYEEIKRISELWKSIKIYSDCSFNITYCKMLDNIDIDNSKDLLINWIIKYKDIFSYIKENNINIIPELSAGLDSRVLTYFWRDNKNVNVYSKNDKKELEYVNKLIEIIKPNTYINNKDYTYGITISGQGNGSYNQDIEHLIKNFDGSHNSKHIVKDICPFLDKQYLRLTSHIYNVFDFKIFLQFLLCKDLCNIPYITRYANKFIIDEQNSIKAREIFEKLNINLEQI